MVEQTNNYYQHSLNWVELSWFQLRVDQFCVTGNDLLYHTLCITTSSANYISASHSKYEAVPNLECSSLTRITTARQHTKLHCRQHTQATMQAATAEPAVDAVVWRFLLIPTLQLEHQTRLGDSH